MPTLSCVRGEEARMMGNRCSLRARVGVVVGVVDDSTVLRLWYIYCGNKQGGGEDNISSTIVMSYLIDLTWLQFICQPAAVTFDLNLMSAVTNLKMLCCRGVIIYGTMWDIAKVQQCNTSHSGPSADYRNMEMVLLLIICLIWGTSLMINTPKK